MEKMLKNISLKRPEGYPSEAIILHGGYLPVLDIHFAELCISTYNYYRTQSKLLPQKDGELLHFHIRRDGTGKVYPVLNESVTCPLLHNKVRGKLHQASQGQEDASYVVSCLFYLYMVLECVAVVEQSVF